MVIKAEYRSGIHHFVTENGCLLVANGSPFVVKKANPNQDGIARSKFGNTLLADW